MAQPRAYTRSKDFTENFGNESDHSALNAELDAAGNSINDIRTNLAKIQGDDGKIKPGSITSDSVSADLKDSLVDQTTESVKPLLSEVKENANAAEAAKTISIAQAAAAATSETNAGTRATAAASSASSASSSATAASGSASAAAGSASSASTSAVNAASSATAAAGSASSASSSATSASTSASTASTKAGEAASSASSASTSASSAATAASTATAVTSGLANTSGASLVGYLPQGANGAATTTKGALDRLIKPRVDGNISRKIVFAGSSVASGNNATSNNGWAQ